MMFHEYVCVVVGEKPIGGNDDEDDVVPETIRDTGGERNARERFLSFSFFLHRSLCDSFRLLYRNVEHHTHTSSSFLLSRRSQRRSLSLVHAFHNDDRFLSLTLSLSLSPSLFAAFVGGGTYIIPITYHIFFLLFFEKNTTKGGAHQQEQNSNIIYKNKSSLRLFRHRLARASNAAAAAAVKCHKKIF